MLVLGLVAYQFSTSSSLTASSTGWSTITNTKSEITKTYSASSNGTYYFYVKDAAGNINKKSVVISKIDKTPPLELGKGHLAISRNNGMTQSLKLSVGGICDQGVGVAKVVFYYKKQYDYSYTKGEERVYAPMYGSQTGKQGTFNESFTVTFNEDVSYKSLAAYVEVYDVLGNMRKSYYATISPAGDSTSYTEEDML